MGSLLFLVKTQKRLHLTCKQTKRPKKIELKYIKRGWCISQEPEGDDYDLSLFLSSGRNVWYFLTLSLPAVVIYILLPQESKPCKNYVTNTRTICVGVITISELLYAF